MFLDDADPPVLRIPASMELALEFQKDLPYGPDDPFAGMLVRATGNHVQVEQQVIGTRDLPGFFRDLYDDFRGWTGERTWRSLEDELRVTARHDRHVHLRWELTRGPYGDAPWTFTTTTHHGAGEDMRSLAEAFDELLDPRA